MPSLAAVWTCSSCTSKVSYYALMIPIHVQQPPQKLFYSNCISKPKQLLALLDPAAYLPFFCVLSHSAYSVPAWTTQILLITYHGKRDSYWKRGNWRMFPIEISYILSKSCVEIDAWAWLVCPWNVRPNASSAWVNRPFFFFFLVWLLF